MTITERGIYDIKIYPDMVEGCDFEAEELSRHADDIRHHGVMVFPVVRGKTSEVVVGHITIAACLKLGRQVCRCKIIEGTNAEIDMLRCQYAEMSGMDADEAMLRAIKTFMDEEAKVKEYGAKARALDRYAANVNISPDAAKKRFQRAERRLRHRRFMKEDRYEKCPIEDWGVETDRDFRISLFHLMDRFRHMKSKLTEANRALEATQDDPQTAMPESRYKAIRGYIEKAQRLAHASVPYALCPVCAGADEGVRRKCEPCLGMGYATNGTIEMYGKLPKTRAELEEEGQS